MFNIINIVLYIFMILGESKYLSKFERPGHNEKIPDLEGGDLKYNYVSDGSIFTTTGATLKAIHTPGLRFYLIC